MIFNISVSPGKLKTEMRILEQANGFLPHTSTLGQRTYLKGKKYE